MNIIQKIFFWLTISFFVVAVFTMTIGQILPIEFRDWKDMHWFYDFILQGLPIFILLTLIWTIRKHRTKKSNVAIAVLTIIGSIGAYFATIFLMFSFGFGAWIDEEIIYENKENFKVTINQQIWDIGAFGYGGRRTVKLTPCLGLWNIVTEIDTATIDKNKWELVSREGNIKFP